MSRKQQVNANLARSSGIVPGRGPRTPLDDDPRARRLAAMDAGPGNAVASAFVPGSTLERAANGVTDVALTGPFKKAGRGFSLATKFPVVVEGDQVKLSKLSRVEPLPSSATLADVIAKLNEILSTETRGGIRDP